MSTMFRREFVRRVAAIAATTLAAVRLPTPRVRSRPIYFDPRLGRIEKIGRVYLRSTGQDLPFHFVASAQHTFLRFGPEWSDAGEVVIDGWHTALL